MGKQWLTSFLGGSKITADGDCSHKIKRFLLHGRKVMSNLDSLLKTRDIPLPTKVHLVEAIVFSSSHVWMWELDYKESWVPKKRCFWTVVMEKTLYLFISFIFISWRLIYNIVVVLGEDTWESLGLQGDPSSPSWRRSVLVVHWKDQWWSWNCNTLATWCEELTHLKRPWCWERLKTGGEGDNRGWDGWMASLARTQVWVGSGFGDGQGGLACCSSWDHKVSDMTVRLNWTELNVRGEQK